MLTRRLCCPSCGIKLKVADTLPPGKMIVCPKCKHRFAVAVEDVELEVVPAAETRSRKPAPPPDDDGPQELEPADEPRPVRRKRMKRPQKKATGNTALVIGVVLAGVAVIGAGVAAAVVYWPSSKQNTLAVSDNSGSPEPPGMPSSNQRPKRRRPRSPAGPAANNSSANTLAAGQAVFQANCARCHGTPGSGRPGRAPDLSHTGSVPGHTAEWLTAFARNPKAVKPGARMRAFDGQLSDADLKAVGEYLASLK